MFVITVLRYNDKRPNKYLLHLFSENLIIPHITCQNWVLLVGSAWRATNSYSFAVSIWETTGNRVQHSRLSRLQDSSQYFYLCTLPEPQFLTTVLLESDNDKELEGYPACFILQHKPGVTQNCVGIVFFRLRTSQFANCSFVQL